MNEYLYQRQVIAYHGCDVSTVRAIIDNGGALKPSEEKYDWLGKGIYFWEYGPERAMEWAEERKTRGKITTPAVIGAVLNLGECFDLLDTRYTETLRNAWPKFVQAKKALKEKIPVNTDPELLTSKDRILRHRDCAAINWTLSMFGKNGISFDSVRGVFQEDDPIYEGSDIKLKSHIQIAIRNPACIVGYFLPS
ncbi:MAG: hypothetical protein ACSHYA_12830 [Opitutaceae bacterium]